MTVSQVIQAVDEVKPNAFSTRKRPGGSMRWREWCRRRCFCLPARRSSPYSYEQDKDAELLVQPPHDKLYPAYLEARVDYANGEYEKYQNTMQMF